MRKTGENFVIQWNEMRNQTVVEHRTSFKLYCSQIVSVLLAGRVIFSSFGFSQNNRTNGIGPFILFAARRLPPKPAPACQSRKQEAFYGGTNSRGRDHARPSLSGGVRLCRTQELGLTGWRCSRVSATLAACGFLNNFYSWAGWLYIGGAEEIFSANEYTNTVLPLLMASSPE